MSERGVKHAHGMVFLVQAAKRLQLLPHGLIDGAARGIVGRDDDGVFRTGGIALRYRRDALLRVYDLRHPPLLLEHLNAYRRLVLGQMLDGFQQFGIFLAHDLVKLGGLHPGLLQLLEGLSGIDALMLARVADEQYLVLRADLLKKVPHLLRRCQRRFIDHIEMLAAFRSVGCRLRRARKPCNVSAAMPASRSCCAARDVGAKPSTA